MKKFTRKIRSPESDKYVGTESHRSSWELAFMRMCDTHPQYN